MSRSLKRAFDAVVVEQASHWLMLQWQGELSLEQQRAFIAWQQADPQHLRAWNHLQKLQTLIADTPANMAQATLRHRSDRQRRGVLKLLGLMLLAGGGYTGYTSLPWRETLAEVRSPIGQRRHLQLSDGSQLWLNTDTSVNIRYSALERRIQLVSGELLLESAVDVAVPTRALLVETPEGEVEALGTIFSVRSDRSVSQVNLLQGTLRLTTSAGQQQYLQAGQAVVFDRSRFTAVQRFKAEHVAWREGKLIAERQALGEFVAELQRYRSGWVRCDSSLQDLPVTGVFHLDNTEHILMALEMSLPVRIRYLSRYWVSIEPLA